MKARDDGRGRAPGRRMAPDDELALKVAARRNALVGRWAADRMGLGGRAAEDYIAGLVEAGAGDDDPDPIALRVMSDLLARGVPAGRDEVESRLQRFTAKARAEIVRGALR